MLFTDPIFLFGFLPAVFGLWTLLRFATQRDSLVFPMMIATSLCFYSWANLPHVALLTGSIILNFATGVGITRSSRRVALILATVAVFSNLALLAFFKYAGFFTGLAFNIVPPLAISFFTFQQISYVCDTYKFGTPERDFFRYAFVVSFFPHLIAGPIVRYQEVRHQLDKVLLCRTIPRNLSIGLFLIVVGLSKKLLVADSASPLVDTYYSLQETEVAGSTAALLASFAFYLQIYFDFSGYTDIAIGIARLFNIRFPNNFDYPYSANTISEFWRRWHVTLSRFLRDYLYIPLGGGRGPAWQVAANLMVTMLLGGLWHGAAWNFVAWGGVHGVALVMLHLWQRLPRRPITTASFDWAITQLFVFLSWIPFRAPSLRSAQSTIDSLFSLDFRSSHAVEEMVGAFYSTPFSSFVLPSAGTAGVAVFLIVAFSASVVRPTRRQLIWIRRHSVFSTVLLTALAGIVAITLWNRTLQAGRTDPFIYFQF